MKTKKTPAPRRAGTGNDRRARELRTLDSLEHLRRNAPKRFDRMMRLLAKLVAEARRARRQ